MTGSLWKFRDVRVRHEEYERSDTLALGNRWVVYDPADGAVIAVRYSATEAHALADGYCLGNRAGKTSE